jgi:hypothetical protein
MTEQRQMVPKKKEKENKSLLIFYGWNENEPTSITQEGEIPGRMFQSSLLITNKYKTIGQIPIFFFEFTFNPPP